MTARPAKLTPGCGHVGQRDCLMKEQHQTFEMGLPVGSISKSATQLLCDTGEVTSPVHALLWAGTISFSGSAVLERLAGEHRASNWA